MDFGRMDPEIVGFEVLDALFLRTEGFFCSLDVLYGDLGISKRPFLIKKV
jgi:hypothetical protein